MGRPPAQPKLVLPSAAEQMQGLEDKVRQLETKKRTQQVHQPVIEDVTVPQDEMGPPIGELDPPQASPDQIALQRCPVA